MAESFEGEKAVKDRLLLFETILPLNLKNSFKIFAPEKLSALICYVQQFQSQPIIGTAVQSVSKDSEHFNSLD